MYGWDHSAALLGSSVKLAPSRRWPENYVHCTKSSRSRSGHVI